MKKLFRLHFTAIAVSDLLLLGNFYLQNRSLCRLAPALWFYFYPCSGITAISLGFPTQKHFSEIYPQINKKFRFYYLGVLISDFLLFVLLAFVSYQRFLLSYANRHWLSFYFILYDG